MLKIATIIGARPQFIKAATVSRAISRQNNSTNSTNSTNSMIEIIIHTGQHYDENLSKIFFDELQIPKPDYNLGIGSDTHGRQTGKMLGRIEDILIKEKPDIVLTYGDTNSTLAGALAAAKLHIPSAHVEAGLRSYNRKMPEEINRIVADHVSNILFCPTETAVNNLKNEGFNNILNPINSSNPINSNDPIVLNVGDVMFDSLLFNKQLAQEKSDILRKLHLLKNRSQAVDDYSEKIEVKNYCLVTIHRPENTDTAKNLQSIFEALRKIAAGGIRVIVPLHPRSRNNISKFGLSREFHFLKDLSKKPIDSVNGINPTNPITIINPVGYLDMIQLEKHAVAILTDSGGIQKEAFLMGVPCITLRNETEWIETVQAGWNILTGPHMKKIMDAFSMLSEWNKHSAPFIKSGSHMPGSKDINKDNIFGDGRAAEKIVEIIVKILMKVSHKNPANPVYTGKKTFITLSP